MGYGLTIGCKSPHMLVMSRSEESAFDWSDEDQAYWCELASAVGATEQAARYAYARTMVMSKAASARFAGYAPPHNAAGYRAENTRQVQALLALAKADGRRPTDDPLTEQDEERILTELAVSSDPNIRIRALDALKTRRAEQKEERERGAGALDDPIAILAKWAQHDPLRALVAARQNNFPFELSEGQFTVASKQLDDTIRLMIVEKTKFPPRMNGARAEEADATAKPVAEAGADAQA